jgi:hypothetical protein
MRLRATWQFVLAGGDGVREDMPAERKADAKSKLPGAYIDGVDAFDAAFFGTPFPASSRTDFHAEVRLMIPCQPCLNVSCVG